MAWAAIEALGSYCDPAGTNQAASQVFDALRLREVMAQSLEKLGTHGEERWRVVSRIRATFAHAAWAPAAQGTQRHTPVFTWLHDPEVAWLIGVHEWEGVRYFNKEAYERFLWWMALRSLLDLAATPDPKAIAALESEIELRLKAAEQAQYRTESLLKIGKPQTLSSQPASVPKSETTATSSKVADKEVAAAKKKSTKPKKPVKS